MASSFNEIIMVFSLEQKGKVNCKFHFQQICIFERNFQQVSNKSYI